MVQRSFRAGLGRSSEACNGRALPLQASELRPSPARKERCTMPQPKTQSYAAPRAPATSKGRTAASRESRFQTAVDGMRRSSATKALSRLVAVLTLTAGVVALPISGVAAAATPPIVSTGGVSNVTFSSAVLNGSINARGRPTNFAFQYGTSKRYDTQTPLSL